MRGVAAAGRLQLFQRSVDRRAQEVLLEAGELGTDLFNNLVSLFSNLLVLRLHLCLLGLVERLADLLRLRQLGDVDAQRDVVLGQALTLRQLVFFIIKVR